MTQPALPDPQQPADDPWRAELGASLLPGEVLAAGVVLDRMRGCILLKGGRL